MSATPVFNSENINARVYVEPTDVINEGMIKKEIIINDKIAEAIEKEENEKEAARRHGFRFRRARKLYGKLSRGGNGGSRTGR